jgi:hypothetical protein
LTYSFRLHYCPEVDSWEVKVAGVWGWQTYHLHVPSD